ncbi:MAG TPA: VanZ family protein [Gemmatimonadales bacterium]|nr:VanZ family protein [Gemmatimonadales bacterium]
MTRPFRWGILHSTLLLAAILRLTIWPDPQAAETASRVRSFCLFGCGGEGVRDVIQNVLLFLPLGWSLRQWTSARNALAAALVLTVAIELSQLAWLPGRDASVSDILSNLAGAWLGVRLARGWRSLVLPGSRRSRALALGTLAAWLAVLGATGLALRPRLVTDVYHALWAHDLGGMDLFRGTVLAARVNDREVLDGPLPFTEVLRDALTSDSFLVTVRGTAGPPVTRPAPILSLYSEHQDLILAITQSPRGFQFRATNGMAVARLKGQVVELPPPPGLHPGSPLTLRAGIVHRRYVLRAESGSGVVERTIPFSVGWGWTSLLPFEYALGPGTPWLSALWLGGLLFPVGYWSARGFRPGLWSGLVALAALGGLAAVPALLGLPQVTPVEWAGTGVGLLAGWSAGTIGARAEHLGPRPGRAVTRQPSAVARR